MNKRLMLVLGLLVVASMILAACQPQTIEKTVIVTKEVIVTQVVTEVVEKTITFTTAPFALGDLKVRQALAYCTDKGAVANAGYPLLTREQADALTLNTFITKSHWAYAGDENITIYPFDVEKGKALLEEAGWTIAEGDEYRTNADGIQLAFKFTTTTAAFRQAWAAVWEKQMKDCGIRIIRFHVPASWWFGDTTGLARRDYELGAFAWVGEADPGGVTLWGCDQIPSPENGWEGQNGMGWCNEAATVAIKKANNTLNQQERIDNYRIVQAEYTKDIPALPMFNRSNAFATAADLVGYAPKTGQTYESYNAYEWERPGQDTIVFGFTQEPASLYTLVESAYVASLAASFVDAFSYTSLDFNFAPQALTKLPYIGDGSTNDDVEPKEGDMVVDANGDVVALAAGTKVNDTTGTPVEWAAGTKMKQLTSTFAYVDGLTWSDGVPLKGEDFELAYKVSCDKESGATSFFTCDRISSLTFSDAPVGYTVTYLAGYQPPLYYTGTGFGWQPAHRVIESEGAYKGMMLKDVPAKDWPTLPEVAEKPIGVGPYMITEWVKGEKIVFAANPYFYLGAPKTPNLVIKFITAENAEAQLLTGEVDILDSTTLAGLTQTLVDAATAGTIVTLVIPSATWEHIDFNLTFGQ
jgi:ABC-type transport system substrate-binding protein